MKNQSGAQSALAVLRPVFAVRSAESGDIIPRAVVDFLPFTLSKKELHLLQMSRSRLGSHQNSPQDHPQEKKRENCDTQGWIHDLTPLFSKLRFAAGLIVERLYKF